MELLLSSIRAGFWGVCILTTGLVLVLLQAVCFVVVWPWSKNTYRKINSHLVMSWSCVTVPWYKGIQVELYTDSKTINFLGKEKAIVLPNHRYTLDFLVIWILAKHFNCLSQVVSKNSLKYIPVIGWISWFIETIYVKRDWSKDEKRLKLSFQALQENDTSFWLTYFLEGTRLTREKFRMAQAYAVSNCLPIPNNVLIPRTKGFVMAIKYLHSSVPAIYDVTIAVPKGHIIPSMVSVFSGKPFQLKVKIKRYSMDEVPKADVDVAKWCKDRFMDKDTLLDKFFKKDKFDDQICYRIRPKMDFVVSVFWSIPVFIVVYLFPSHWEGVKVLAVCMIIKVMIFYALILHLSRNPIPLEGSLVDKSKKIH